MPASEARLIANRRNAQRSTGPKTPEGKERSRANALKHGLAGDGTVIAPEKLAEVENLNRQLQADLNPSNALGRILVRRMAVLAVRMDECVGQQAAASAERIRNAGAAFDDARLSEAERMLSWIAGEPATYARRLRQTPEGLDLMLREWSSLGYDLFHPRKEAWDHAHLERALNLMGRRTLDFPVPRLGASKVLWGDPSYLEPAEIEGKDPDELRCWATLEIEKILLAEVARLRALRALIDEPAVAIDRLEAPDRAVFDTAREAILARRYEAAAERGFYKALKEFREVEAEARAAEAPPEEAGGSLGSFGVEPDRDDPDVPEPLASVPRRTQAPASRRVSLPKFVQGRPVNPARSPDRGMA